MSDTLQPRGLQHARLPCPSLCTRVCSNSCSLGWWCYLTFVSIPGLLWIMLQWTWKCRSFFKIIILCPLDIYTVVGFLGHTVVPFLISWGTTILFSIVVVPVYTPTTRVQGFPFLYVLTNTCYFLSFDNSHSDRCEVVLISHCGFDFHFLDDWWCWEPFHASVGHINIFSSKMSISVFSPYLNLIFLFVCFCLLLSYRISLYIFHAALLCCRVVSDYFQIFGL